jgi:pimeloyl-ACP methyl ester carboxylesterase
MNMMESKTAMLHGRPVSYVVAGGGPAPGRLAGVAGAYQNWKAVIEPLARAHTVVAPDLPGHGGSAPGAGDYSLGALAVGLRDLLVTLGHKRATLVGHSLGGGIAMQFAYHFPEIVERLVLVSSGGLGPEVSLILARRRAARCGPVHCRDRRAGTDRGQRDPARLSGRRGPATRGYRRRIASCARSPWRTGMIGSRAPQMISTGNPSER